MNEDMINIVMLLTSRLADDSDFDDYLAPQIDKLLDYLVAIGEMTDVVFEADFEIPEKPNLTLVKTEGDSND